MPWPTSVIARSSQVPTRFDEVILLMHQRQLLNLTPASISRLLAWHDIPLTNIIGSEHLPSWSSYQCFRWKNKEPMIVLIFCGRPTGLSNGLVFRWQRPSTEPRIHPPCSDDLIGLIRDLPCKAWVPKIWTSGLIGPATKVENCGEPVVAVVSCVRIQDRIQW